MNYQKEFDAMLESIKMCSEVSITEQDFYIKEEILPSFYKKYRYAKLLGEEIKVLNDNKIRWVYSHTEGEELPMGETHLISIEEIVSGRSNVEVKVQTSREKDGLKLIPFDDHPTAGDGIIACLRFIDDRYEIWLCDNNFIGFKIDLSLSEYLEKLVELKAIYGWQYLFAEIDFKSETVNVIRKELRERLMILHKCFPDLSVSNYMQKL